MAAALARAASHISPKEPSNLTQDQQSLAVHRGNASSAINLIATQILVGCSIVVQVLAVDSLASIYEVSRQHSLCNLTKGLEGEYGG